MTNPLSQEGLERIAAGLTDAQRRWIASAKPLESLGGAYATYPPSSTCQVLHRLGLWLWCGMLTERGNNVRSHLLKGHEHG